MLCSFKAIVHYSTLDANPRVIWDALYCGVPFFASEKCQIPQTIGKFGIINNNISGFYKLLEKDFTNEIYLNMKNNFDANNYIINYLDRIIKSQLLK